MRRMLLEMAEGTLGRRCVEDGGGKCYSHARLVDEGGTRKKIKVEGEGSKMVEFRNASEVVNPLARRMDAACRCSYMWWGGGGRN